MTSEPFPFCVDCQHYQPTEDPSIHMCEYGGLDLVTGRWLETLECWENRSEDNYLIRCGKDAKFFEPIDK